MQFYCIFCHILHGVDILPDRSYTEPVQMKKGAFAMVYILEYGSPLGTLHLASDGENLTGLWMEGQKYYAATIKGEETADGSNISVLKETAR